MTQNIEFQVSEGVRRVEIADLVVAGWTGRDRSAVERHIAELAGIGVKRPRSTPCFYRLGARLLTTASEVEVVGQDSSGEVEFVLISAPGALYVGIGSDHTDRKVEAYGVTVSKQMCPKPVGRELWRFADLEDHWDRLVLRSHVTRAGKRRLYQEGAVSAMLAPHDLLSRFAASSGEFSPGTAMFGGTLAVEGGIGGGERFEIELHDPVGNRSLRHQYAIRALPIPD
ncbi:MAG: DUF2848 domain-containing protein [Burkholderiales bacterium]